MHKQFSFAWILNSLFTTVGANLFLRVKILTLAGMAQLLIKEMLQLVFIPIRCLIDLSIQTRTKQLMAI